MAVLRIHFLSRNLQFTCILLLLLLTGCMDRGDTGQRDLLRSLPPDMIRHLISSDDTTLARYGREIGIVVLLDAGKKLDGRMCDMYIRDIRHKASTLISYYKRIARILASEYDYNLYFDRLIFIENLPAGIRSSLMKMESDFYSIRSEIHLPAGEKLKNYKNFLEKFKKHGDLLFTALCEYEMSYAQSALGNEREQIEYLRAACRDFAGCGLHEMTVPTLCELGSYYERTGKIDSMIVCFEEAARIARHCRLPWEAAQVSSIYAGYYARHGRLSLAYDQLMKAMEICREYKGEYSELEFIVETMAFQAEIGCWEIVDRLLERARLLQGKYGDRTKKYLKLYSLQIDRIEARTRMAQGDVDEAEAIFKRTGKAIENLDMPYTQEPENAKLFIHWSEGLLENGFPHEALGIIGDGFQLSQEANLPEYSARFALLEARAAFKTGDMKKSGQALRQFDHLAKVHEKALRREWIERDVLLGRLELGTGDRNAAVSALEDGLTRLKEFVMNRDASVQSYLWIGECGELRRLMHDVTSHDPVLGYGAELYWRDFYRLLGQRARPGSGTCNIHIGRIDAEGSPRVPDSSGTIMKILRDRAEGARNRVEELKAIHSIYLDRGGEILRWTASSAGIHRETLDTSTGEVRKLVTGTWKMISKDFADPDTIPLPELHEKLRTLAQVLLPPEVLHPTPAPSTETFLITTGGFLSRIPFETFNIGKRGEYIPLLMHRDVAYLRHTASSAVSPGTGPGVILVNAKPSKGLLKRYPFQPELEEAMAEGEVVASLNPGARLLAGESASKSDLLSMWEGASFLYIAAHMLRDPQVPYLMLIPLASPGGPSGPDAAYLDITDIRAADFSICNTVILSGCSSGAPYLEAGISGPSLGDAFLDSGAGAVVHTFWDVRDKEARRLMTSYVQSLGSPVFSGINALCKVRREQLQESERSRHPFGWASYSIKIGRL